MNFHPDVSLQRLAAIAYSLSLLKESDIQIYLLQDVRYAHSSFHNNGIRYVSRSDLDNCHRYEEKTENFLKNLKKKQLPKAILNQVLCVTEGLLKRLRVWYEMVVKKLQIHHTYSDKVYWTCYGTIDIPKIISNEWTKWFNQDGELIKLPYEDRFKTEICEDEVRVKALNIKLRSMGVALRRPITKESKMPYLFRADNARFAKYYMACACVWISYIKSHCYEMLQLCQMCSENNLLRYDDIIEYVVCTVLFFSDAEKLKLEKFKTFYDSFKGIYEELFKDLLFFEKKRTANEYMLLLAVVEGNYVAVKYYWNLLSSKEKDDLIVTTAVSCLQHLAWDVNSQGIMHSDTLIFLLSEMSEDQRKCFFKCPEVLDKEFRSHFVTIFLDLMLWEELFFSTFEALKFHFTKKDYYYLLEQIAEKMTLKNISNNMIFNNIKDKIGYDSERTIYYGMFVTVFEEMRKNPSNESALPLINKDFMGLEYKSFKLFNIPILKLLMDFECEDSARKSVLNPCKSVKRDLFKMLLFENQFELLDKFVKAVLKSEEEIDWFKKCFRYSEDFITQDKIETLDNLLDWQSKSNEERRKLKYKAITELDLMGVCGKLFLKGRKFNINLAKKAKKWGFSDYQDRQNYLSEYKGDSLEWLNKIWRKYQNKKFREEEIIEAKTKTIKFLKFFLDTDDEVERFIKEKFININEVENFVPITNILISSFY